MKMREGFWKMIFRLVFLYFLMEDVINCTAQQGKTCNFCGSKSELQHDENILQDTHILVEMVVRHKNSNAKLWHNGALILDLADVEFLVFLNLRLGLNVFSESM